MSLPTSAKSRECFGCFLNFLPTPKKKRGGLPFLWEKPPQFFSQKFLPRSVGLFFLIRLGVLHVDNPKNLPSTCEIPVRLRKHKSPNPPPQKKKRRRLKNNKELANSFLKFRLSHLPKCPPKKKKHHPTACNPSFFPPKKKLGIYSGSQVSGEFIFVTHLRHLTRRNRNTGFPPLGRDATWIPKNRILETKKKRALNGDVR